MIPLLLTTLSAPAWACGGMFCDSVAPVDQSAERIIFSFDGEMLNTEVQISYQGQDDDFAWVVPVPAEPELYVSNDALFTQLANATIPTFSLLQETQGLADGGCDGDAWETLDSGLERGSVSDSASLDTGDSGAVNVVSEQTVGPYETVVLQATNSDVLVQWLQDQGYSLPDTLSAALEPYVADGQYFVALKLSADKAAGDLAPLGMRYPATAASIPIQLTAVAAVPDLPIEVFVLGPSRAVPDNYLHVEINDAAIDWYGGATNYRTVVAKAADEAGGQAFATDFVGPTDSVYLPLWSDNANRRPIMEETADPIEWLDVVLTAGIPPSSQLSALLVRFVPPPEGVSASDFLACPDCYAGDVSAPDFDPVVATAALDEEVLQVMIAQKRRFSIADTVTRLFTTMDPEEMTADPIFVFNADLPQSVPLARTATDRHRLSAKEPEARALVLADGREYTMANADDPTMSGLDSPAALVIEDLGASGLGTVIFDGTADARAQADAVPDDCAAGCSGSGAGAVIAPLLLLAAGVARRRRR